MKSIRRNWRRFIDMNDEKCCVCDAPMECYYIEREDCPSCGRPSCELKIQCRIDEEDAL